jgi:preprotein translocase subunit YajC
VGRVPEESSEGSQVSELAPLLWIVAIAVIFWLLIIRPAQRRQKEVARVQASIAPGETVILTSGIFGTVSELDDATVQVEISPGVNIKVARGAVSSVVRPDDLDEPAGGARADDTTDTGTDTATDSRDTDEER